MIDFTSFFLSDKEIAALKHASSGKGIDSEVASRLEGLGLLTIVLFKNNREKAKCEINNSGVRYLDYLRHQRADKRWTRGLAIAAIIISLAALALELDDRGYLGGLLSGLRTSQNVQQVSEQS